MIERFRAASGARQLLLTAIAAAIIFAALAAVWFLILRTPFEPLFTQMRSNDAAAIVAELDKRKIAYRLGDGGSTILVPAEKVDSTRLAVMSEDLPIKGTVGFELFNKSDMGLTDFAQKINYQRALQGELARTIMTLDGVESARIHLSLGEDRIFRSDRVPPKASVTIRMKNGATLSADAAQGVQRLVAAAVPQLDVDNVVIVDEEGRVVSTAQPTQKTDDANTAPTGQIKQAIEQYYRARIRNALEGVVPQGDLKVEVKADLTSTTQDSEILDWSPSARRFGLHVAIISQTPLEPQAMTDIRGLVASALALDNALGDSIAFSRTDEAPPTTQPNRSSAAPTSRYSVAPAAPAGTPLQYDWLSLTAIILLALLVAASALLLSRRRGVRRLTSEERLAFAERLNAALTKGGVDVTAR
jgi:flagellar M-ring protein FliF